MFVGVYWSERRETRDEAAARVYGFIESIAGMHSWLSTWFKKGRLKKEALTRQILGLGDIRDALTVNRRDIGGGVLSDLGFSLGLWNGNNVALSITIGSVSPFVRNSVVLSIEGRGNAPTRGEWGELLRSAISAFDPEYGVVTSSEDLVRFHATDPWDVGLFVYDRDGGVQPGQLQ